MSAFLQTLSLALLIWTVLFSFVKLLEFSLGTKWERFVEWSGLSFSVIQVTWHTTLLNKVFLKVANRYIRFWKVWFLFGVAAGVVLSLGSVVLCIMNLVSLFNRPTGEQVLTPVIPGVNVPTSQLFHYFLALLLNGVLHELGHAIAGVCERIRLNGFGIFIAFLYPGAYVDFKDESALFSLSPTQQLRIYCAGSWHNIVVCFTSLFLLSALPTLITPFYRTVDGMAVVFVKLDSPLHGHLSSGDIIQALGDHPISDKVSWQQSYGYLIGEEYRQLGYCVSEDSLVSNGVLCCQDEMLNQTLQCFQHKADHMCLDLKATVTSSQGRCNPDESCVERECVLPVLNDTDTRIIKITRTTSSGIALPDLVFVGHPAVVFLSVETTNVLPRDYCVFLPWSLPLQLETLLHYMFSFGGALAMLNLAPVYYLDGEWALKTFLNLFFPAQSNSTIAHVVLSCGSALLVANLVLSLWSVM